MSRQKPTQVLLKEATIHFYCLFDESGFSDICKIMELKELNWFCEHTKNVRSSQPCTSMKFCTEFSKAQILLCEYRRSLFCNAINDFMLFLFLSWFISFRTKVRMSIITFPFSIFFALHLEWSPNLSTDKESNSVCIFANLCSTLFSLWFKFSSASFYFQLKCTKKRGWKLIGKNLNVDRQFFKGVIRIFWFYSV